jgi:hypothetical protein
MVVEGSGMSDVPLKSALPRKSAFSCEACRKRKVGLIFGQIPRSLGADHGGTAGR